MLSLYFVLFFSFICGSIAEDSSHSHSHSRGHEHSGGIVMPCASKSLDCIRQFFANNSNCTPCHGPAPEPLIISHAELPIPHANLTFIQDNAEVWGFNDVEIRTFHLNEATGNLVLELLFKEFVVSIPTTTLRFHRRGREPVDITDYFYLIKKSVSMTLIVPYRDGIDMSKSHVYTYLEDNSAYCKIGPAFASKDPEIRYAVDEFVAKLTITLQEAYVIKSDIYTSVYINSNICNFSE